MKEVRRHKEIMKRYRGKVNLFEIKPIVGRKVCGTLAERIYWTREP